MREWRVKQRLRTPFARRHPVLAVAAHVVTGVSVLVLSGCAVGPDFVSPPPPSVDRFTPEPVKSAGSQQVVVVDEIPARWWEVFHNKNLNALIEAAIEQNASLQAAQAAIRIAYYQAEAQKGGFLPQLTATSGDTYQFANYVQTFQGAGPTNPYGLFQKVLSVSYTPDIWGQNLRAVESLEAQTDQQRYQLEAAYLTLTSNVASAATQEAALRGQLAATREVINEAHNMLSILRKQYAIGAVAQADVLVQEAALAQMEQLLPPLEKALALQRDLLTALAGQYSTAAVPETFNLRTLALPDALPLTLPSAFVRQRPDVRAAEANMHSLSAQIGVAIAARLPNVTLSSNAGVGAFNFAKLFSPFPPPGSGFWVGASNVAAPIFDGFTLLNKQRSAEAALTQAEALYRQAVITAFQNVADALRALQADAKAVRAAIHSETVARKSFEIVKKQFLMKEGSSVNMLQVLNAEQTWLQASSTRMQAEGTRLTDVVGLFMALGGGWKDENLKRLSPTLGPVRPTLPEVAHIDGPVNPDWFPTGIEFGKSLWASDAIPPPPPPLLPPMAAPVVTAPGPAVAPPVAAPPPATGWFPKFLE
ncbi:histidine kinase [Methylocystis bryophila]|nr:histidine kinase [Methylocystis bryophila]